jgi:hypothetical protein
MKHDSRVLLYPKYDEKRLNPCWYPANENSAQGVYAKCQQSATLDTKQQFLETVLDPGVCAEVCKRNKVSSN